MIKIIEELPELTLESILKGNHFPELKKPRGNPNTLISEGEFFDFLKVGEAIEGPYLHPPTLPQIIEFIVKNPDKMNFELYRRLTTVTSTAEMWNSDTGIYVVSHGVSPLEYKKDIRERGGIIEAEIEELEGRVIKLKTRNIEEAVGFMYETPEEKVTYIIPVGKNINNHRKIIDLARIGYTAVLGRMLKLASEKAEREITAEEFLSAKYQKNVKNPLRFKTGYVNNGRGVYFAHLEPTQEELRWSFFPRRYSLLLPKNLKHIDSIEDKLSPELYSL